MNVGRALRSYFSFWDHSEDGFAVRGTRTELRYRDHIGEVRLPIEQLATPSGGFMLFADELADLGSRDKDEVIAGLRSLAAKRGWELQVVSRSTIGDVPENY